MRKAMLLPSLGLMLLLCGCVVYTTNPLYTAKDLAFDPGLVGVWSDKDKTTWTVRQAGDRQYEIVEGTSDDKSIGRLVRLGKQLFLDLEMHEEGEVRHFFCRLSRNGDELTLGLMSPEWLRAQIEAKRIRLAHRPLKPGKDEDVILTASTREIQALALKHANDPAAFTTLRLARK